MSGLEKSTDLIDRTDDSAFIEQTADRILAWEFIHAAYCARKTMRPCRLAERMGLQSREIQGVLKSVAEKAKTLR